GEDLSALPHLGGTYVEAGHYVVGWSFDGDTNHRAASSTAAVDIGKADAGIVVNGYTGVYDAAAHGVVGSTATGVGGAALTGLVVDATTYTDVPGGLVHWTFTKPNYKDQSGDAAVTITRAGSVTTVTAADATYDGSPHGGTAAVAGVGGLNQALTVTYTGRNGMVYNSTVAPTAAGDYTVSASYAGDTNHDPSAGSKDFTIAKATSATSVTGGTFTYDATGHGATVASVTGAGGLSTSATLVYK